MAGSQTKQVISNALHEIAVLLAPASQFVAKYAAAITQRLLNEGL
jgi:hypothetical protein